MAGSILRTLVIWCTAVMYGALTLMGILREAFKQGFGKVFSWKPVPRPSCLDDPTLGTHGYLHLEDVRIHYLASGPEDKPLMLFVHGFPEFWYSWRNQIKEFQKDYRCVAIDMRGYGESDKPPGIDNYTLPKLMSDIKQVILALGYKSCVLVSHDWGGVISFAFGRLFPDFVDRLIVMNAPPSPVFQKVLQNNKEQRKMSWYIAMFQLPYLPELFWKIKDFNMFVQLFEGKEVEGRMVARSLQNPMSKEDVNAYRHTFSQPGAMTPPINYYRANLRGVSVDYDINYVIPVLLIWGCKDMALSRAIPDEVEKANPQICVKRIEEAGHFVAFDTPELTNKAMREWLDEKQQEQ